jgi:hypothetical protein
MRFEAHQVEALQARAIFALAARAFGRVGAPINFKLIEVLQGD